MIIVRAPLRISFVGGGTDLPDFYRSSTGRVISTAIDKYVYIVINPAPLLRGITARYSIIENVKNIRELKNDRIREALLYLRIKDSMEIGTFSHMPVGTGLGGSSSFAVALMKGLSAYIGRRLDKKETAELASYLEIELVKEPIGKQDQYATAFGGFNVLQFNPDDSVDVDPVLLGYKKRLVLEDHMLLFFTGISRLASSVLTEQKAKVKQTKKILKSMADSAILFKERLSAGDFRTLGKILHENWSKKKTLASTITNTIIDELYEAGIKNGAWGGKVLGAGSGGCILFLTPIEKKGLIRKAIIKVANRHRLDGFQEVPVRLVQSGVEILSNTCPPV